MIEELDPHAHLEALARERLGRLLKDKWRLDDLLGIGGMAAVYAATHRNGKRAAIKVLHPTLAADGAVRARFLREGYVANKVAHPGAVSVLDDDVLEDGSAFLVMELLEGESLDSHAQKRGGSLPPEQVLDIAHRLLDVLEAAHAAGVVHRDLKPENVFLAPDGMVKVLDFGIARLRETNQAIKMTGTGVSMGTPSFMAPEQARGRWEQVDARTDLWAVGATMYALLTGRLVHEATTVNEVLLAAMTTPAPPLTTVMPTVSPRIAAVVDRALAFDKGDRWQSAAQMAEAIAQAYEVESGRPIPPVVNASPVQPGDAISTPIPVARREAALAMSHAAQASAPTRRAKRLAIAVSLAAAVAIGFVFLRAPRGASDALPGPAQEPPPTSTATADAPVVTAPGSGPMVEPATAPTASASPSASLRPSKGPAPRVPQPPPRASAPQPTSTPPSDNPLDKRKR
jgi:serine/threonine-protein kinase